MALNSDVDTVYYPNPTSKSTSDDHTLSES